MLQLRGLILYGVSSPPAHASEFSEGGFEQPQPLSNARRDAFVDVVRDIARHGREGLGRSLLSAVEDLAYRLPDHRGPQAGSLSGLNKMPPYDLEDPVMSVAADRHRELVLVVGDLALVERGLRREDIVEWGKAVAAFRLQYDAKVLAVPIRRSDQPKDDLALEEVGLVLPGFVRALQQLEDVHYAWPANILVLLRRRTSHRLAAVLLRDA